MSSVFNVLVPLKCTCIPLDWLVFFELLAYPLYVGDYYRNVLAVVVICVGRVVCVTGFWLLQCLLSNFCLVD